jgi:hypothetical protein
MRQQRRYAIRLVVVGILTLSAHRAEAQTTAVGPYYATPSWDQTMACTAPVNCPRFVVLSNFNSEAVLDRETGLVWERSPDAHLFLWSSAVFHCSMTKTGNRMGWRLPTVAELTSLIDPATSVPPAGHPFVNVQQFEYWSGTSNMRNFDFGYAFELYGLNRLLNKERANAQAYVWCVRGGQGADGQ